MTICQSGVNFKYEDGYPEKKIIFLSKWLLIILIFGLGIFLSTYIDPTLPLKYILRHIWVFFIPETILILLIFKIIENYYESLHEKMSQFKLLNEINYDLTPLSGLEDICQKVLKGLCEFYGSKRGVLFLLGEEFKKVTPNLVYSFGEGTARIKIKKNPGQRLEILYPGQVPDNLRQEALKLAKKTDILSFPAVIIIPFLSGNSSVKALTILGIDVYKKSFFEKQAEFLHIFSRQIIAAMENSFLHEEIKQIAITDDLTGLYNRRYFQERIKEELQRCKRKKLPFSLVISDLDNFKGCVDTYGHTQGSNILKEVGQLVKSSVRQEDLVFRFGGDEFAYIMPFTTSLEAENVVERVRLTVSSHPFIVAEGQTVSLSLSMGIASFPEHEEEEVDEIIKKADMALFQAKAKGKNSIYVYRKERT